MSSNKDVSCNCGMQTSLFGLLNVYKPKGITSHDVVSRLRKVTKIKQIGHTGTLDPFAEGVLPVCIGKATRLIEYLNDDKEYLATIQFGKNTTTYDIEGEIVETFDKRVSEDAVINELKNFEGEISQVPPIYSAIKVNGKKLYEYARKGEEVQISPRKVFIEKIQLVSFDKENQSAQILIKCSKGTYIRSIAYDLGKNLSCGGYLTKLVRTQAGKCFVVNSIDLQEIDCLEKVEQNLINPVDLIDLPKVVISDDEHKKVIHGMPIKNNGIKHGDFVILIYNDYINAVGVACNDEIKVKKVF